MKALSIRPPWAWAIIRAGKDIENRSWCTSYTGRFLVHASSTLNQTDFDLCCDTLEAIGSELEVPCRDEILAGGLVGSVELVEVVTESTSPWFADGYFGWVLANPLPMRFIPYSGSLKLFEVPDHLVPAHHLQ